MRNADPLKRVNTSAWRTR